MRAMVLRGKALAIEEVETPKPGPMQVLAKVLACGICGSDLHAAKYMEDMIAASRLSGAVAWDSRAEDAGMVMGHEFIAEVVEAGAGAESWAVGHARHLHADPHGPRFAARASPPSVTAPPSPARMASTSS